VASLWLVGCHHGDFVACCLDHRRVHPQLQRPARTRIFPVRILVHVRAERIFLALSQLGKLHQELAKDESDCSEHYYIWNGSRDLRYRVVCERESDSRF
jgi:hypothetical protein